mgnify:CR=1 FL=1
MLNHKSPPAPSSNFDDVCLKLEQKNRCIINHWNHHAKEHWARFLVEFGIEPKVFVDVFDTELRVELAISFVDRAYEGSIGTYTKRTLNDAIGATYVRVGGCL